MRRGIPWGVAVLFVASPALAGVASEEAGAQERPQALEGAEIIPIEGDPIENGVLVVSDGTIDAVGPAGQVDVPADAEVHDVAGKTIMPGLVDTHSHIGGGDGGDGSAALHPDARIVDSFDPRHESIKRARTGGVTTANVMPGSGHLLSGQTIYIKLRDGRTIYDLLVQDTHQEIPGGIKMANGTNSIRGGGGPFPGTRARSASLVREKFLEAREYRDELREAQEDPNADRPSRDLEMEGLVEVLDGDRQVHFHTHTHFDILTAIRLGEEFGFEPVLHHVSDGWKVAEEIAEAGVMSSIIVLDSPGGKHEAVNIHYRTGAALEEAGADFSYHTDDGITDSRIFLRSPAFGVRAGLSEETALESVTLAGARQMGLEDRVGSLVEGKDADFIVLDGHPLSVYTLVQETWIDGERVFDRSDEADRQHHVGGS